MSNGLNPLEHFICFTQPLRIAPSSWTEHIPFAMYLVDILRPKVIVELGTYNGVSYCAFCQAVKTVGIEAKCYAVDTWRGDEHSGFYGPEILEDLRKHHDSLYGSFSRLIMSTFDDALNHFEDNSIDLLHIDGYHTYEAVKHDFESWLPKVSKNGMILFHDINVREKDFGVWKLWTKLKEKYRTFEFMHGHGLGVLAKGESYPKEVEAFLALNGEAAVKFREFFYRLGFLITSKNEIAERTKKLAERDNQIQLLTARLVQQEGHIQSLIVNLAERDRQIQILSTQLAEMKQAISNFEIILKEKESSNIGGLQAEEEYRQVQKMIEEGNEEVAISKLEAIIDNFPEHALANNDLGVLYFMKGETKKALEKLEKAYQIDPNNLDIMKNLADVYIKQREYEKALAIYEKILLQNPSDVECLYNLGALSFELERMEDALFWWHKVLEVDPEHEGANFGVEKIKNLIPQRLSNSKASKDDVDIIDKQLEPDALGVSIIIPVFNQVDYTRRCLEALYKNTPIEGDIEVIIVDNGSTDDTWLFLKEAAKKYANLRVHSVGQNLGFARACNIGAEMAKGEFLVFLNNDTEPQENWLMAGLKPFANDISIGIVGAKLLYPDRTIQHCGIEFIKAGGSGYRIWPVHRYRYAKDGDLRVNQMEEVEAVTGACLFIRKDLFKEVGGFSEKYGMYFEDTDLCFKVRQKGKKILFQPECVVIHYEGKSSPNQSVIDELNKNAARIFFKKWAKEITRIDFKNYISHEEGRYIYLKEDILPEKLSNNFKSENLKDILLYVADLFQSIGPFYAHFGGIGDALLLLSIFYDKEPEQTIVSMPDSSSSTKSLFEAFPLIKKVFFIPFKNNFRDHAILRRLFNVLSNCKGMGVTPVEEYEKEWVPGLDIFEKYKIQYPQWAISFKGKKIEKIQITIGPKGSMKNKIPGKRNIINPAYWRDLLDFLEGKNIHPIILGTPDEKELYPATTDCIDRRSYSIEEQMRLIASSDIFIGADTWGKTFAALAKVPSIVFYHFWGEGLEGMKDFASDSVFLDPWKEITVVRNFEEFKKAFEILFQNLPSEKTMDTFSLNPIEPEQLAGCSG